MKLNIKPRVYYLAVFTLLVLSGIFSLVMIHIFSILPEHDQTFVGTIAVSNYDESRYENIIQLNLLEWEEESIYKISYQNIDYTFPLSYLVADLESTINNIQKNKINDVFYTFSSEDEVFLIQDLENIYTSSVIDSLSIERLTNDILRDASKMETTNTYYLETYLDETSQDTILSTKTIYHIDNTDVTTITDTVQEIEILSNERFYLLDSLSLYSLTNEQLCIIASGLLGVAVESHFTGFIFEQNPSLYTWSEQGLNVRILNANQYDFSLFNPYRYNLKLSISKLSDTSIQFDLIGYPYVNDYLSSINSKTSIPYSTTYIQNDTINPTTPNVIITETDDEYIFHVLISEGINGEILEITRTTTFSDGTTSTDILYYETYSKVDAIYEENAIDKETP